MWAGVWLFLLKSPRMGFLLDSILPAGSGVGWIGVVLVTIGLGLACWARWRLGKFWSGSVTLKVEHRIVRSGPYALTRHPIYTGLLAALAGTVLVQATLASVIGFSLILTGILVKIRQEEALLIRHFGEEYRRYQRDVPRLVPWVRHQGLVN